MISIAETPNNEEETPKRGSRKTESLDKTDSKHINNTDLQVVPKILVKIPLTVQRGKTSFLSA
jgi:hypothetical protein